MKRRILMLSTLLVVCLAFVDLAQARPLAKHVILIGLDGWGSYSVNKAEMPHVEKLARNGASTYKKRAVLPSSSAVNWASMFMGSTPEMHGYTEWGSQTPEIPSAAITENGIFPTLFYLLRKDQPEAKIAAFYDWKGIEYLIDTIAVDDYEQVADYKKYPRSLCEKAVSYIQEEKPNLLLLVWDDPDHVGHAQGHNTKAYYDKLKQLDKYIGEVIEAVEKAGMMDETIFIVTSDHGGINKGHGKKSMQEVETPFIVSGKGIKKNHSIEATMMQFDVASTIAEMFDLDTPDVWRGVVIDEIFR